jgi:hypothetical protein
MPMPKSPYRPFDAVPKQLARRAQRSGDAD